MRTREGTTLLSRVIAFWRADDGLTTVEWTALAGAVLIGAVAIGWVMRSSLQTPSAAVGNTLNQCESTAVQASGSTSSC